MEIRTLDGLKLLLTPEVIQRSPYLSRLRDKGETYIPLRLELLCLLLEAKEHGLPKPPQIPPELWSKFYPEVAVEVAKTPLEIFSAIHSLAKRTKPNYAATFSAKKLAKIEASRTELLEKIAQVFHAKGISKINPELVLMHLTEFGEESKGFLQAIDLSFDVASALAKILLDEAVADPTPSKKTLSRL